MPKIAYEITNRVLASRDHDKYNETIEQEACYRDALKVAVANWDKL